MEHQIAPVFPRIMISCKRGAEKKAISIGAFLDQVQLYIIGPGILKTRSHMSVTAATPRNDLVPRSGLICAGRIVWRVEQIVACFDICFFLLVCPLRGFSLCFRQPLLRWCDGRLIDIVNLVGGLLMIGTSQVCWISPNTGYHYARRFPDRI